MSSGTCPTSPLGPEHRHAARSRGCCAITALAGARLDVGRGELAAAIPSALDRRDDRPRPSDHRYAAIIRGSARAGRALPARAATQPARQWHTRVGGPSTDHVHAVAGAPDDGVLLAGDTGSFLGIATAGAHQPGLGGSVDAFVVRLDDRGRRVWGTYLGGERADTARALALDPTGAVLVAGTTESDAAIATAGAHQPARACPRLDVPAALPLPCPSDGFLARLDLDGARQWSTYLGGEAEDYVEAVAVDPAGDVYLCGATASATGIATDGAAEPTRRGGFTGFLAKVDAAGERLWGTYVGAGDGSTGDVACRGLAVDGARDAVYLAGYTRTADDFATPGAHQERPGGGQDAYLARYDGTGHPTWRTLLGGEADDAALAVRLDAAGAIYLAGQTGSDAGVATPGAWQPARGGEEDAFLAKFTPDGVRLWATYVGGDDHESGGRGLSIDGDGDIHLAFSSAGDGLSTPGAAQLAPAGSRDLVLTKWSPVGALLWSTYVGGEGTEYAPSLATRDDGVVYLAATTTSQTSSDGFVARMREVYGCRRDACDHDPAPEPAAPSANNDIVLMMCDAGDAPRGASLLLLLALLRRRPRT
jgi:hypothetical protein